MTCSSARNLTSTVNWIFPNGSNLSASENAMSNEFVQSSLIVTEQDGGHYVCVSNHSNKIQQTSINVTVFGMFYNWKMSYRVISIELNNLR